MIRACPACWKRGETQVVWQEDDDRLTCDVCGRLTPGTLEPFVMEPDGKIYNAELNSPDNWQ